MKFDLLGWKEVAAHCRVGTTTVRRWAREGMPIHRDRHGRIAADSQAVDNWRWWNRGENK